MNFQDLRKYQKNEKRSELGKLPDTFYEEVQEYCKNLEENKDFPTLNNVVAIVERIRHQRFIKMFNRALAYLYHNTQNDNLDDLSMFAPNLISSEVALFRDIVKGLLKHDHYVTQECKYLKK